MKRSSLVFFLFAPLLIFAQTRPLKGKVTDENNVPVQGVNVVVKGSRGGAQTDVNGNFSINGPAGTGKLQLSFSHTGFKPVTVSADENQPVNVTLRKSDVSLEDVVVIGYQTKSRKDVLAPVASISAKDLKDVPLNSAEQALTGRLAGVQVTTSEGSPDASVKITVRGGISITQDNSPLYIVDGIPIDNALASLSPQDIQSIDVLKDASATAIYGARGANGVVIITTKAGKNGKTNISYNGFYGIKDLPKELDVLHPYDFIQFQYERSRFGRYINNVNSSAESSFASGWGTTYDTLKNYANVPFVDWQHIMMGKTQSTQTHNLSMSGGNDKTTYNLSLTNNNDYGLVLNSKYLRNMITFKMETKATDALKVGLSTRYTSQVVNGSGTSDAGSTAFNRLRQSVKYKPVLLPGQDVDAFDPAYAAETNGSSLALLNPVLLSNAEYRKRYTTVLNITGYAGYTFDKHLSFRSTFGLDVNRYRENFFEDTITPDVRLNGQGKPIVQITTTDKITQSNSNVLTYNYTIGRHHSIDGVVGQELTVVGTKTSIARILNYSPGIDPDKAIALPTLGNYQAGYPANVETEQSRLSFFGRINYDYDKKYLLSVTMRADGSSKFAPENRWAYFPSVSAGWRIFNENFMKDVSFLSDLKLRAGVGVTGNDRIDDYRYVSQYAYTAIYGLNNTSVLGYQSTGLANPNLKWESNTTRNIGVDAAFFKNRLSLTVDVYQNTASNLLINVPIPTSTGYPPPTGATQPVQLQNIGGVTNKGIEISLSGIVMQKKDFTWNANFNIAFNKNVIDKISDVQSFYYDNSGSLTGQTADFIVKKGQPVGSMYGFVTDGMYRVDDFNATLNTSTGQYVYTLKPGVADNTSVAGAAYPGTVKFKDLSGPGGKPDGIVDANNDRTIIGNANPKFTGGFNQTFTYKGFDASVFVNFVYGNNILNANKLEFTNSFTPDANVLGIMKDRWRYIDASGNVVTDPAALATMNANAKIWIPSQGTGATAFALHSWAIEDGSFLRINNVSIGYTLPSALLSRIKISKVRFYVTGNNLAVLTSYTGYDPEVNSRRNTNTTPGVDYSAYPRARSILFGMNLTF